MTTGIYKITSPTNKVYIGQSVDIERRWKEHKKSKEINKLKSSFISYGFENHTFEILEECIVELLNERERYYQDLFDVLGPSGLNLKLTNLTDSNGPLSQETRNRISEANRVYYSNLSEEEKLKKNEVNSNSNKGRVFSEEHIKNLTIANQNPSKEHRRNLSICKSKKVIDTQTGEVFESIILAANSIKMTVDHLRNCLKGECKNKTNFKYYIDGNKTTK